MEREKEREREGEREREHKSIMLAHVVLRCINFVYIIYSCGHIFTSYVVKTRKTSPLSSLVPDYCMMHSLINS
jgi:hypothetical protein